MSNVSLFGDAGAGNSLVNSDLFKSLQSVNDTLAGGSFGTHRRISIKGGKFREMVGGEQVSVSKDDTMNIIVIDAAPVARTYYAGAYDPNSDPVPPSCWSADTQEPSSDANDPQASRCADCPQNVKGSGQGNSRACRYSQRLAVTIEGDLEKVYQLQLPATSIFGDATEGAMPMQGYARFLKAHNTPAIAVVTEMRFDENAEVPKLFFKPLRPLTEEELEQAVALRDSEETKDAITFTVSQTDGVSAEPVVEVVAEKKPAAKKSKPKLKAVEEAEPEVEEPTKVVKKSSPTPSDEGSDLSSIVGAWDDDE